MKKYLMVTGASALELERKTGIRGVDTSFGVFAEKPKPVNIDRMMEVVNDALYPNRCKCSGPLHWPECRAWMT